jgi:uncharacterized membrane protein
VHTLFTTRYARLYCSGRDGGIAFSEPGRPRYTDFTYVAFTIGMTFQVSDTTLQTSEIRRTALRHALLSYVFGVGIIATTINHVPGVGNERSEVGVQASRRRRLIAAATSTAAA